MRCIYEISANQPLICYFQVFAPTIEVLIDLRWLSELFLNDLDLKLHKYLHYIVLILVLLLSENCILDWAATRRSESINSENAGRVFCSIPLNIKKLQCILKISAD